MKKLLLLIVVSSLLLGCTGLFGNNPATPQNVTVTGDDDDESQAILISWSAADQASVYFIYRADSADGEYELIGQTAFTSYRDTDVEYETTYYYCVASGNLWGTQTSSLSSPPVSGQTREFAWETPIAVASAVSSPRLYSSGGNLYIAYIKNNSIVIEIYDPDEETLIPADISSPGTIGGSELFDFTVSSVLGDTYTVVFTDSAKSGGLTVSEWDSESGEWHETGNLNTDAFSTGFDVDNDDTVDFTATSPASIKNVTLNDDYIACIDGDGNLFTTEYSSGHSRWIAVGNAPIETGLSQSSLILDTVDATPGVAFISFDTPYLKTYSASTWSNLGSAFVTDSATSNNLALDTSGLYLASQESDGMIHIRYRADDIWDYIDDSGLVGTGLVDSMCLLTDNSSRLVLLADTADRFQAMRWDPASSDDDTAVWKDIADPAITGGVTAVQAAFIGSELYLIYISDSTLYLMLYR